MYWTIFLGRLLFSHLKLFPFSLENEIQFGILEMEAERDLRVYLDLW